MSDSLDNVPAGFTLVMTLPNQFTVIDSLNTKPSTCILKDYLLISSDVPLTTTYDSANPQMGQCGVSATNTYTFITPQTMIAGLRFVIGNIKNPLASYNKANMGALTFSGYLSGSTTANYAINYNFESSSFTPGTLFSTSSTQTNTKVGQ